MSIYTHIYNKLPKFSIYKLLKLPKRGVNILATFFGNLMRSSTYHLD